MRRSSQGKTHPSHFVADITFLFEKGHFLLDCLIGRRMDGLSQGTDFAFNCGHTDRTATESLLVSLFVLVAFRISRFLTLSRSFEANTPRVVTCTYTRQEKQIEHSPHPHGHASTWMKTFQVMSN